MCKRVYSEQKLRGVNVKEFTEEINRVDAKKVTNLVGRVPSDHLMSFTLNFVIII